MRLRSAWSDDICRWSSGMTASREETVSGCSGCSRPAGRVVLHADRAASDAMIAAAETYVARLLTSAALRRGLRAFLGVGDLGADFRLVLRLGVHRQGVAI